MANVRIENGGNVFCASYFYAMQYRIEGTDESTIADWLSEQKYSQLVVLADTNTRALCLPKLVALLPEHSVLEIEAGEQHKNLETAQLIWHQLAGLKADRATLLLCVGGGMVTDIGGFTASTYLRGIRFAHVPTTLLGMADAAIGGKTGVDLGFAKNMVGSFAMPEAVFCFPAMLETLAEEEVMAGWAEVLKHSLIDEGNGTNGKIWKQTRQAEVWNQEDLLAGLRMSYYCKSKIVAADPKEQGLRKVLNVGHTIGHALESMCLAKGTPVPHGMAIAAGMMCEAHIAFARGVMSEAVFYDIEETIFSSFVAVEIGPEDMEAIYGFVMQDKKNRDGQIGCALLHAPGKVDVEATISLEEIGAAIVWYRGEEVGAYMD